MINLLPAEEKQELIFEKKRKLAMIFGIVVLVVLICLILILLSIKFYLLSQTDAARSTLEYTKMQSKSIDFDNYALIIKDYNEKLSRLDNFYSKEIYFDNALNIILNVPRSENLKFTNFSLNRTEDDKINISISGTSETRDDLLAFKKSIEETEKIKNPVFSSASWISPNDVKFSLTFQVYQYEAQ
jgi:hypothetical protein